jgi:hypothetical protein
MAKAIGTVRSSDLNVKGQAIRVSSGRGSTMTPARGLGASMVADLDSAIASAKAQHRADRIAAARERLSARLEDQQIHSHLAVRF